MRVNFFIDGLNLYYGMLRSRPHLKWLDLRKWCESLTDHHVVHDVHYFTASVRAFGGDQGPHVRQDAYLRALRASGGVAIHEAHFTREPTLAPRVDGSGEVEVWKIEEKCSDVNIASHMMLDAAKDACDILALVSNDSDLKTPVSMLQKPPFRKEVWVFNPTRRPKSGKFRPTIHLDIDPAALASAQLPRVVIPTRGRHIHRPNEWV